MVKDTITTRGTLIERLLTHNGGYDQAVFYDSPGNDVYSAWTDRAVFSGRDIRMRVAALREHLQIRLPVGTISPCYMMALAKTP